MVGCLLVRDGQIIGQGWHGSAGLAHAEPAALEDCRRSGHSPAGATAYVTLEPCCHLNKRTPPCAPRLIEAGIARVVIGCLDPNPDVNGKGVAMLRAAGIVVDGPMLQSETLGLIEPFLCRMTGAVPYITLKWAESADGKVAGPAGRRTQISGVDSSQLVQVLRARSDGIAVGIGTVLNDDPMLTPRDQPLRRPYTRLVLDRHLRLPHTATLARTARQWPTAVIYDAARATLDRRSRLEDLGLSLYGYSAGSSALAARPNAAEPGASFQADADAAGLVAALQQVVRDRLQLGELLVEPGPTLAASFFAAGRVDRLWVIRSPRSIADPTAPAAARIPDWLVPTTSVQVGADTLTEYRRALEVDQHRFAPVASADIVTWADASNVEE